MIYIHVCTCLCCDTFRETINYKRKILKLAISITTHIYQIELNVYKSLESFKILAYSN